MKGPHFKEDKRNVMKIRLVGSYFPNISYWTRRLERWKTECY